MLDKNTKIYSYRKKYLDFSNPGTFYFIIRFLLAYDLF